MTRHDTPAPRGQQRGVGLIEILIAVVVLSIGFLAAARMQVQGMRFSQSAYFQSQAYFMASDIIDRMRSNPDGVRNGDYDDFDTAAGLSDPACDSAYCTPARMARQDLFDWSGYLYSPRANDTSFIATLPSSPSIPASGHIDALGDGVYTVRIVWSEQIGEADEQQQLIVNFAPES